MSSRAFPFPGRPRLGPFVAFLWRFAAGEFSARLAMRPKRSSFRVGRVQCYLRGQVWYLCYHERPSPSGTPYANAISKALADAQTPSADVDLIIPCGIGIPSH